jgi:hypothetical protein
MRQLAVVDIDRTYLQAHGLGVLDSQMPKAARPGDDEAACIVLAKDQSLFELKSGGCGQAEAANGLDHLHHHGLGIAVDHVAIIFVEQRVDDAGIAFTLAALDDINLPGLIGIQNRHAKDGRGFV